MEAMIDVAAVEEVESGTSVRVDVEGKPVCLVNLDGAFYAIHDTCTHALQSLSGGYIEDGKIECPRHGAFFRIVTGEAATPPATQSLPTFSVEVRDGRVWVHRNGYWLLLSPLLSFPPRQLPLLRRSRSIGH